MIKLLCFRYRKLLIPYFEGELSSAVAEKVERHLAKCPRCRTELDGIRLVAGALSTSDMPAAEPADDLWARVSAQIADGSPRPARFSWLAPTRGLAAGLAAAVIVAVVSIKLLAPSATTVAYFDSNSGSSKRQALQPLTKPDNHERVATTTAEPAVPKIAPHPAPALSNKTTAPKLPSSPPVRRWFFAKKPAGPSKPVSRTTTVGDVVALGYGVADRAAKSIPDVTRSAGYSYHSGVSADAMAVAKAVVAAPSPGSPSPAATAAPARERGDAPSHAGESTSGVAGYALSDLSSAAPTTSVVDDLNETEGVRTAALFSYP